MQIYVILLCLGSIQLALLITAAHFTTDFRIGHRVRFTVIGGLLLAAQSANLVFLLLHLNDAADHFPARRLAPAGGGDSLLFFAQGIVLLLVSAYFTWVRHEMRERRRKLKTPGSIREAIDFLPGGICFSTPSGRPVLTNRMMNSLCYTLTGRTVINARAFWEDLRQFSSANGCSRLDEPWLTRGHSDEGSDESMFFSFPDGSIWRFRMEYLTDRTPHYTQYEATDISELYRNSRELFENNRKLALQYERQQNLLANIVEINHKKEILSMKMWIHDNLGRCILTTKQQLSGETLPGNVPPLDELWGNAVRSLTGFTRLDTDGDISPEIELRKAADMIGCSIDFRGERPVERRTALLFYATVREALTNAVRHAGANRLNVKIVPVSSGYRVEISDNGSSQASVVTEGSGLSNLRKRLEQEGASLEVKCADGVVLVVEFPSESKWASAWGERTGS